MGAIWMDQEYADELKRWGVPTDFADGCWKRARSSGGYDHLFGIIIHHDGSGLLATLASMLGWATVSSPNRPIGAGTGSRKRHGPKWLLWAAGATNTAGRGGPLINSAGEVIPLDSANRNTVNTEWMNRGDGSEWWDEDGCDLFTRWCCATLSWINRRRARLGLRPLGAGDIWAHFEWAPGRKFDPFGPCRWNGYRAVKWNMDNFRQEVFCHLLDGPGPLRRYDPKLGRVPEANPVKLPESVPSEVKLLPDTPRPTQQIGSAGPETTRLIEHLTSLGHYLLRNDGKFGPAAEAAIKKLQADLGTTQDGVYGPITAAAYDQWRRQLAAWAAAAQAPPPAPPPKTVQLVAEARYTVKPDEWAWSVAAAVYGDPRRHPELTAANRTGWLAGARIVAPGIPGLETKVEAGEGPKQVLKRIHGEGADQDVTAAEFVDRELATFYRWNGGSGRMLHPGDPVGVPVTWGGK